MKTFLKQSPEKIAYLHKGIFLLLLCLPFLGSAQGGVLVEQMVASIVPADLSDWESPNSGIFELNLFNEKGMPLEAQIYITIEQNRKVLIKAESDIFLLESGKAKRYKQFDGRKWPNYQASSIPRSLHSGILPIGELEITTLVMNPMNNQIIGEAYSNCTVERNDDQEDDPTPPKDECAGSNDKPIQNLDALVNQLGEGVFANMARSNFKKWNNFQGMCGTAIISMQQNNRQLFNKFNRQEAQIRQIIEAYTKQNSGNHSNQGIEKVTKNYLLPPSYQLMHKQLGDEKFGETIKINKNNSGNFHGIARNMLNRMKSVEYQQFKVREGKFEEWYSEVFQENTFRNQNWADHNQNGSIHSPNDDLSDLLDHESEDFYYFLFDKDFYKKVECWQSENERDEEQGFINDGGSAQKLAKVKKEGRNLTYLNKLGLKLTEKIYEIGRYVGRKEFNRNEWTGKTATVRAAGIKETKRRLHLLFVHGKSLGMELVYNYCKALLLQKDPVIDRKWLLSYLSDEERAFIMPLIAAALDVSPKTFAFLKTLTEKEQKTIVTIMYQNPQFTNNDLKELIRKYSGYAPKNLPKNLTDFVKIRQAFDKLKANQGAGEYTYATELFDLLKISFMKKLTFQVKGGNLETLLFLKGVGYIAYCEDIEDLDIFSAKALGIPVSYTKDYWLRKWGYIDRAANDLKYDKRFQKEWRAYKNAKKKMKAYLDNYRKSDGENQSKYLDKQRARQLLHQCFESLSALFKRYGQKIDNLRKWLDVAIVTVSTIEKTCDKVIEKLGERFPHIRMIYKGVKEIGVGIVKKDDPDIIALRAMLASLFELVQPVSKTPYKELIEKSIKSLAVAESQAWIVYNATKGTEEQKIEAYKAKFRSEFTGQMGKNVLGLNKLPTKWLNEFLEIAFDVFLQPRLDELAKKNK